MIKRPQHIDWALLLLTLLLCIIGLVCIYSAVHSHAGLNMVRKQLIAMAIGLVALTIFSNLPVQIYRNWRTALYSVNIILLLVVDIMGRSAKGAQRWIPLVGGFNLQPSEVAKVLLAITLADFVARYEDNIKSPVVFFRSLLHVGFPALLVFAQPDLGTSIVIMSIWAGIMMVSGAPKRLMVLIALTGLLGFGAIWQTGVLKDYQKKRVTAFINPASDPRAAGYHVIQARIAVGSGQITGKGLFSGTQNRLNFIPEQHTDFVFTVIGEEVGFAGSIGLLVIYALFLWRILLIVYQAHTTYARALAAGIFTFFAYHIIINIGMVIGVFPVVGVWLPFISFGGSAMISCLSAVGLLLAINRAESASRF